MADWKKIETGLAFNPYYYECANGNLRLSLTLPYKSDPWGVRLMEKRQLKSELWCTVHKESFRLEESGDENPQRLDEAMEEAFLIMEEYIQAHINMWEKTKTELNQMKAGGSYVEEKEKEEEGDDCP